jgi:hypothetical protein
MLRLKKKRGQSTAEYAILIGVVIAALIGMQAFVGRNIKAKIADSMGYRDVDIPANMFTTTDFEPFMTSDTTTNRQSSYDMGQTSTGVVSRSNVSETVQRTGNQVIQGTRP